jgi:hypothetical protein
MIDALAVDKSWQKRRELTGKSSGRNPNRLHRKALRVIGIIGKRQPGNGETDRGMEDDMMRMRVNIIEGRQTCIQSNVEPERKRVVAVVWRGGEARRHKRRLERRAVRAKYTGKPSEN